MERPPRRPRTSFDDYAASYDSLHAKSIAASGEPTHYFAQYKVECLLRLGLDRDAPILDYGCGIGNLTEQLVDQYTNVHAFDPSKNSLEMARRRAPEASFYEDASQVPRGYFSAVVLSGVLHHVSRDGRENLLRRLHGALVPGGKLVVFEHNPLNPLTRRAVHNCPFDDDAVLLWPREGRTLVERAGFSVVANRYIVFFPRALARLRRWEPKLAWLPAGAQWMMVASA